MIRRLLTFVSAAIFFALPAPAPAQPLDTAAPFTAPALSDRVLADVRGTASPYASLSRGALVRMFDNQARSDFRLTGSVGTVQMDVWWGTVGSELIANAVRDRF